MLVVVAVFPGSVWQSTRIWNLADILNGLMAIPNLIGRLLLSGVIASETKRYFALTERERE